MACPSLPATERDELILDHLPRVRWIARQIHQHLPVSVLLEDLVSVGIVGLIEAVDRYDPAMNVKLKTFADYRIRGAILDSIAELDGVPAHKRSKAKRFETVVVELEQKLHRTPNSEEIAAELGISMTEYFEWIQDIRGVSMNSLGCAYDNGHGWFSLADTLADAEQSLPFDVAAEREMRELLDQAIRALPPQERKVMILYFRHGWCLREIAASIHVHITRVSQLKTQATERLRQYMTLRWNTGRRAGLA